MRLLPAAGPPGRFPVRLHAPQLSFLARVNRPVRPLRTGAWAARVVNEGKQVLYFGFGQHGFENRMARELDRFVVLEGHGLAQL